MILVDFSQIAYANIHMSAKDGKIDENFLRHLILNSILHIQRKHAHKYGREIILACDNKNCWRVDAFAPYKWERKHNKDKDGFDWDAIHAFLNQIQSEIRTHFRYAVINVNGAEGDDVIAVMAKHAWEQQQSAPVEFGGLVLDQDKATHNTFPTLIVSSDKDYGQLGYLADQYDPRKHVFITSSDPDQSLRTLILKGDGCDGIPNILTDDDVFMVQGKRQKSISKKLMLEWNQMTTQQLKDSNPIIDKNWKRNDLMVNLRDNTPIEIASNIIYEYQQQIDKKSNGLMNYFFQNRLHKLMDSIPEFQ